MRPSRGGGRVIFPSPSGIRSTFRQPAATGIKETGRFTHEVPGGTPALVTVADRAGLALRSVVSIPCRACLPQAKRFGSHCRVLLLAKGQR